MSSSPPPVVATIETGAPDFQTLLSEKDMEIASLKREIFSLKNQLQGKSPLDASVAGIAKKSLKHVGSTSHPTKMEARWKARFQQLVEYKLQHGDCNVAKSYQDKSLHSWVRTQREAKKAFDAGASSAKSSSMTQERVDALNSIGFEWVLGHQPNDKQWEESFQALLQYKQQHSHTRVSQSDDKKLYKWVLNQRARRRLLESKGQGKAKGMTWARVEKLNAIDFCWEATNRTRTALVTTTTPVPHFGQATLAALPTQAATLAGQVPPAAGWVRPPDHEESAHGSGGGGSANVGEVLEAAAAATTESGGDSVQQQYKTYEL